MCTVYPMCFRRYNKHLGVRINHHNANMFDSLTRKIKDFTVCENRDIVDFNVGNNFITPYMHRKVYAFRDQFLSDELTQTKE